MFDTTCDKCPKHLGCYRNRKLFPSIQLHAVTTTPGLLIIVLVGFPGSVHDSRVKQPVRGWHNRGLEKDTNKIKLHYMLLIFKLYLNYHFGGFTGLMHIMPKPAQHLVP